MQASQRMVVSPCNTVRMRRLPLPSIFFSSSGNLSTQPFLHDAPSSAASTLARHFTITSASTRISVGACGFTTRQLHSSPCLLSDNLLGHSPMARPLPTSYSQTAGESSSSSKSNTGPLWGTDSNTAGGGVWAQTSAKKEKLNELLTELNATGVDTGAKGMESLDDAADAQDKLDLEFADGLKMIAKCVDDRTKLGKSIETPITEDSIVGVETSKAIENAKKQMFRLLDNSLWEKPKYEATLHEAIRILSAGLPPDPNLKKPVAGSLDLNHPLCYLREFVEVSDEISTKNSDKSLLGDREVENQIHKFNTIVGQAFASSTQLYRALLLRAVAQTLLDNWDAITAVTSGDIDRAAVSKTTIPSQRSSANAESIKKLFDAYDTESCTEWVQGWWRLIDHDGDGLIDEEEMNKCVELAMKPVHVALSELVYMSLEVCPVRTFGLDDADADAWFLGGSKFLDVSTTSDGSSPTKSNLSKKLSWRNRRQELKARKELTKTFQATLARHFRDQVETPHRLRCIYAWADKSHQNNKIDSIIVDGGDEWGAASSIVGRKRYVELLPKISYPEFRKEQARHFQHLDKIGEDIAMSFKEDLWVLQGKRRQNKELRRDSLLFLLGVSLIDFGIGML